jgi:hypothetical protein
MDSFDALYYPNSVCSPLTLAKSILVFDSLTFYDHTSIIIGKVGTVGHDSPMRQAIEPLKAEGYKIQVLKPLGGPVENELKALINADLTNSEYRKAFHRLVQNDPTFLMTKVPNGNYGKYGDGDSYRKRILSLKESDIPSSISELEDFEAKDGSITPEANAGLIMALDSFNLNFSAFTAIEESVHLFGDSKGMDMLLKAKFAANDAIKAADKGISQAIAFALMEHLIPNKAFYGKAVTDIVRFRNKRHKELERFKERILELTIELQDLSGSAKQAKVKELLYKTLIPEVRSYQNSTAKVWNTFFKESINTVVYDADTIAKEVAALLPLSVAVALLAAAANVGKAVVPNLVNALSEKKDLERNNPYAYLMRYK